MKFHGHRPRGGKRSKEYAAWSHMKQRCLNPSHPAYKNYGGRGITVCERWRSFKNFLADVSLSPSPNLTLDRINNDGNYEPGNVRWATVKQQSGNRRLTKKLAINQQTRTIIEWGSLVGISPKAIRDRVAKGWCAKDAVYTPLRKRKKITKHGKET